jgi:CheY-like chemotaxis protein
MKQSSQQLLRVTNDILDVSRATSGALTIDHHEFDLGVCIQEAVDLLVGEAKAKGLTLAVDVSPDVVGTTQGDFGRLKQVLVNLLGNAIKFTSSGTVELRVSPARTTPGVTHVRFEISDTGTGIPSAVMSKLFQPFVQSDTSLSRRFGGTGLGLAISRQLVELMGGKLSLESAAGKGTLATFVLPMTIVGASNAEKLGTPAEYVPSAAATTDEADYTTNSWAQKLGWQVLVAEDNPVNQAVIEEYLGNLGCTFSVVENGALAVQAFEQGSFDIILMDCQMPEMDGLEATRRIRALEKQRGTPPMPIIAVTAHAFEEDRNECVEAGMNGFVSKPCSLEMLAITMQQCAPEIARLGEAKHASTTPKLCRSRPKVEKSASTVRPSKRRTKDAKEPTAATV